MSKSTFLIIFAFFLAFSSCKISYRFNDADIGEAKTVSIALFDAEAAQAPAGSNQIFTEGLRDVFQTQTRLMLASNNGDLQLDGSITSFVVSPVGVQANDVAALNRLTITVKVQYQNTLDETKNFVQSFSRFADYDSNRSLSDVEQALLAEIFEQIYQDIFNRALSNW
jgi:hypothetical protein